MALKEKKDQIVKKRLEEQRKQKPTESRTASGLTMRQALDQIEAGQRLAARDPSSLRGHMGAISTINEFDRQGASDLYVKMLRAQQDETSSLYNPYSRASNRAVDRLAGYGVDTSKIDDDFYNKYSWLRNHFKVSNYTNNPISPGKRATDEQKAAYEYYQMQLAEDQTQAAEKEQADLEKYLISEATRRDRTLTDEQIIAGINWNKYPTLKKARESAGRGAPTEFNRAISGASDDWAYATLWRAKNPNAGGDYYTDLANSALGLGNTFEQEMQRRKQIAAENGNNRDVEMQRGEQQYLRWRKQKDRINQYVSENTDKWREAYQNAQYSPDGIDRSYQIYAAKQMLDTSGGFEAEQKRLAEQQANATPFTWEGYLTWKENNLPKKENTQPTPETSRFAGVSDITGKGPKQTQNENTNEKVIAGPRQSELEIFREWQEAQQKGKKAGVYDNGDDPRLMTDEGLRNYQIKLGQNIANAEEQIRELKELGQGNEEWQPDNAYTDIDYLYSDLMEGTFSNGEDLTYYLPYSMEDIQRRAADYYQNRFTQVKWRDDDTARAYRREKLFDAIFGYGEDSGLYMTLTDAMTLEEKTNFDQKLDEIIEDMTNPFDDNENDDEIQELESQITDWRKQRDKATEEAQNRAKVAKLEANAPEVIEENRPVKQEYQGNNPMQYLMHEAAGQRGDETDRIYWNIRQQQSKWNSMSIAEQQEWVNKLAGIEGTVNEDIGMSLAETSKAYAQYYAFMTPEQVAVFDGYYTNGDKESAKAYIEALGPYLQTAKQIYTENQARENAKGKYGALYGAMTILENPQTGLMGTTGTVLAAMGDKNARKANSDWYIPQNNVSAIREERANVVGNWAADNLGEWTREPAKFLNNVFYSMADNLAAMGIASGFGLAEGVSQPLVQLIMSSEAAANTMNEQLKNGKDPDEAAIYAVGSGIIEAITEKYSLEALLKPNVKDMLGNKKQIARFIMKNFAAEGSEEGASDVLEMGLDWMLSMLNGHETEMEARKNELVAGGMKPEEADRQVWIEKAKEIGIDMLAGGVSGLLMSGGRIGLNTVNQGQMGSNITADNNTVNGVNGTEALLQAASSMKEGTQSRAIAEQLKSLKRNPSNVELGRLAQNIMNESSEEIGKAANATVEMEARKQLTDAGVDATTAGQLAPIIAKAVTNGNASVLTAEETSAIAGNDQATEIMKTFFSDPMARMDLYMKQMEATADQRSIRQQVEDLASGEGTNKASASAKDVAAAVQDSNVATQAEIRATGGKSKGAANEIVYDRQLGTISRFENGNAVITVNGQEKSVGLHEIKAVNPTAAAVISFAQKHRGLMSDSYATKALQGIGQNSKTETAKYLDDAMKIRLAAMSLDAQPRTSIDSKTAADLYKAAQTEFNENEKKRVANAKPSAKPGQGSATIDGTEYGTQAFQNKLKDMGLSKTVRNQVGALSEISVRAGFRVNFINDTNSPDVYGWYDNNTGTITINLGGENEKGVSHHLLVTAGHEMTHWLENNSSAGYAQLRQFVVQQMRAKGENIQQRLMDTIDNFNSVMKETAKQKAKAEGRELTDEEISNLPTLDLNGAMAEIVANACDQVLGSRAVADELAKVNPSLYNKVKSFVKDFVARIRQAVGGMNQSMSYESRKLMNDVEQMAKIWLGARDEALAEQISDKEFEKIEKEATEKAQWSIKALPNGQQYVQIDTDQSQFNKLRANQMMKLAKTIIMDRFAKEGHNRYKLPDNTGYVTVNSKTANEYAFPSKTDLTSGEKRAKGRASTELNNLIKTSWRLKPGDPLYPKPSVGHKPKNMKYYGVLFKVNQNFYTGVLNVEQRQGWKHLIDLTQIKIDTSRSGTNQGVPGQTNQAVYPASANQTVPKTQKSVKQLDSTGKQLSQGQQEFFKNSKVVDENGNLLRMYHGSAFAGFTTFASSLANDNGFYFTDSKKSAKEYSNSEEEFAPRKITTWEEAQEEVAKLGWSLEKNGSEYELLNPYGVSQGYTDSLEDVQDWTIETWKDTKRYANYATYLNLVNPLIVEGNGSHWGSVVDQNNLWDGQAHKTADWSKYAKEQGYDGVIFRDIKDQGPFGMGEATPTNVYVAFSQEQIKSVNNLNPTKHTDIRFSTRQKNVDTSNYKNYFMRDGQMIQQDGNRNETVLTGADREYVEAWKKGDYARMEEILADKIRENGAIPFKTPASYNDPDHSWVANAIKRGDTYAIRRAAMEMAQLVPKNAVLIPMPNRHGEVSADTDTMILANEIAKVTGSPVVSALAGVERPSRQEDKMKPKSQQMKAEDLGFRQVAEIPEGKVPYIVDNVIASGLTAEAAHRALGNNGVTLAYAKSNRAANAGLKRANVTFYDQSGNSQYGNWLIPLSERIDMSKKGYAGTKFSTRQDVKQQELFEAWQKERDNVQELRAQMQKLKPEMDAWVDRIMEAQKNGTMDDAMAEYKEWEKGYTKVRDDLFEAERRYKEANKAYDDYIEARDVAEEKKQIEASGLSEPEYRRKQAVDHFGYTTDFREAGYLLPNGRMLNFSGEKGRHFGSRGEDHRGIGTIYASSKYQGGEAMMQFMRDGNIRVMAETPGIDIISTKEPTKEQYAAIRNMARRFAGEEYFNVDFTDEKGFNADSIEYDGRVNPEKVVNDIKTYFRTGQAPQQSVVSQFHYSIKQNEAYMKAVDEGNMDEAQRMVDKAARQAGYTIRAYHGTGRADRVGTVFLPERATSGPMAYFTDNKEIAENYARDKKDTSIAYDEEYGDYHTQFRTKDKAGKNIPISQLWNTLPTRERLRIREAAKHIAWDDNMENIIFDPEAETGNGGYNEWTLREHKGNAIEALIDAWLDSGDLYNNEGRFLEVLKLAGIENATWNNPDYREEKVYDTYLKIQNPFNTSTMFTNEFVDGLLAWWEEQDQDKYLNESMGADLWDKNNRTVEEWAETARDNIENGRTTVWTSIPDAVSDYLRSLGHDGIQDQGGKGGGESHTVWIPFSSEQIKSAEPVTYDDKGNVIPLDERFNDENRDIRWSIAQGDMDVNRWMLGLNPEMLNTEQEKNLLKQYKGLRMDLDIQNHAIQEYTKELRKLEAKEKPSAYDREEMRKLRNRIENREQRRQKFEDEIIRVTSSEGYAGMMYRNQNLMNALINNRTADEVRKTVDAISKEIERVKAEESQLADRLNELAANEGVAVAKTYFAKAGLKKVAAKLKSDMNSKMKNSEIESRLATTALKLRKGENVIEDVMDLATLLMERQKSDFDSYVLSELRGRTFVLSDAQMAELKGQHRTLTEIRKELAGTGIKLKTGKSGTLDMVWEELCDRLPMLDRDINDLDMLDNLLNVVRSERNIARESQYGSAEQTAGLVMESVMELVDKAENIDSATKEMISFIQSMAGEAKEAAQTIQDLTAAVERMKLKTAQARGAVSVLDRDVGKAIDYFNTLTAQSEAAIWRQERAKLVAQMKSEKTEALLAEQDKWKEKIAKDKAFRESVASNMATRKQIHTVVSRMATRLFAETDQKNIPEEAKPLVRQILQMLTDHDAVYRKIMMYDRKKLTDIDQRLAKMTVRDGGFDPDADLDWLVVKAKDPADNDTSLRDKVIQDLIDIEQGLLEYRNARGNRETTQHDLKEALNKIQEAVAEIYSMVRARSEAFIAGKRYELADLAEQMEGEMKNSKFKGEKTGKLGRALDTVEKGVGYGNLTPEYFFKNLNNGVMNLLHKGFHDAENRAGLEARNAMETVSRIAQETGFSSWDGQEKHQVKVKDGKDVEMTTEQIMALYATWLRESNQLRPEETAHLLHGGFVLAQGDRSKGIYGREKSDQRPIRMTKETLNALGDYLTDEQKKWVEDIVGYMSGELAEIGNETSMQTWGIKKFTEPYYFPIKAWGGVLNKRSDAGIDNKNDNRAMRQSFQKRVQANARNAIEIGDFTPTAMKHIVGMITFNTVGPAVENMNKVLNQQLQYGDITYGEDGGIIDDDTYKRNVRASFRDAYGEKALKYLERFMSDVNGGMTQQMDRSFKERLLSVFRKNAVAGSLSVALQQPLSYIRAAMLINPKYLAGALSPQYWKGSYAEMLKHSGVAVIKDMGRFDMNQGQSAIDYISPDTKGNAYEKISEWLTKGPELTDRMTWTRMWSAVKMEQHAQHPEMDMQSDEFLDMVGERFNEVMRKTQVYDSMMVKSQNMRSNNYAIKAMTSFMAEPTLSLNVLADAVRNIREQGGKTVMAKAGATFLLSAVMQAIIKGLMGSGRTPDEKKTWLENFMNKTQYALMSEANPFALVPGYSDLIELLKTGELTDDAMSVIGKFNTIRETAEKALQGKGKGVWRDIEDTAGQFLQLFTNIPAKNLMRDTRAMYNWFSGKPYADRENSVPVMKYQAEANLYSADNMMGVINTWLGDAGFKAGNTAYYQRIYDAKKAGNDQEAEDIREFLIKGRGVKPETIDSKMNSMAKYDKDLTEAQRAEMMIENGSESADDYILDQVRKNNIGRDEAIKLLKQQDPKADANDIWWKVDRAVYQEETGEKLSGNSYYYRLNDAVNSNSVEAIRKAVKDLTDHGVDKEKVKKHLSDWKQEYLNADSNKRIKIRGAIEKTYKALGYTAEDADKMIDKWKPSKKQAEKKTTGKTTTKKQSEDTTGQWGRGNINLNKRQVIHNEDGSISTESSFSVNIDGKEVLLPTIINGKRVSENEAIDHYLKTGEYLGRFNTVKEANEYAQKLHLRQQWYYGS